MTSEILKKGDVASNIDLLSAWTESRMAYAGQPGAGFDVLEVAESTQGKTLDFKLAKANST